MMQRIRVECVQEYDDGSVVGKGEYESDGMGMDGWRNAIKAAAAAAGFHHAVVDRFVLDWATDIDAGIGDEQ